MVLLFYFIFHLLLIGLHLVDNGLLFSETESLTVSSCLKPVKEIRRSSSMSWTETESSILGRSHADAHCRHAARASLAGSETGSIPSRKWVEYFSREINNCKSQQNLKCIWKYNKLIVCYANSDNKY